MTEAKSISFDVPEEHTRAIESLAGGRKVRLSGEVRDGAFVVDNLSFANHEFDKALYVAVNAPFVTARSLEV